MDHSGLDPTWTALNVMANVVIVAGYVLVPFTVLRYLPLTRRVRLAGSLFFVTCAITHVGMAFGFAFSELMVLNHVLQAGAVMWFVLGFWMLLRTAMHRAEVKHRA